MKPFKTAYKVVEVPYVKFIGTNIYEVEQFVKLVSEDCCGNGAYSFVVTSYRGKPDCSLVCTDATDSQPVNVGDFIIFVGDRLYVNRPGYFYKHFRVRKPTRR